MGRATKKRDRAWLMGQEFAGETDISPWEALLVEVRKAAYRSAWVDSRVDYELEREREVMAAAEVEPDGLNEREREALRRGCSAEVQGWLEQSRRERTHVLRVAKAAIDGGLAERYVQSVQVEAQMIVSVVTRTLEAAELTPEQSHQAGVALREALHEVSLELKSRHQSVRGIPVKELEQ